LGEISAKAWQDRKLDYLWLGIASQGCRLDGGQAFLRQALEELESGCGNILRKTQIGEVNELEISQDMMTMFNSSWPFILMMLALYFIVYRPQKSEQKKRSDLLKSLKKGDRVVTVGGLYGTVTALSEKMVTLKVADKVELEFARSSVSQFQASDDK
jgi:preprotein translocase subunit YajC